MHTLTDIHKQFAFLIKDKKYTWKTRIILLLTRITSFHVYVLERYDICMVRCDTQREWHVTGSALSWRIVLSHCDITTIMLWQSFTVEVVLKVISVGTTARRHIHVNITSSMSFWSSQHVVGLYWVPGHSGGQGNEIADKLARDGSVLKFVGPEPALGVSRQDVWRKIRRWLVNQHWVWWQGLGDTQRQAWELIVGPVWVPRLGFYPLTGHNPGMLLAFSQGPEETSSPNGAVRQSTV
jgi:hypothetical protein